MPMAQIRMPRRPEALLRGHGSARFENAKNARQTGQARLHTQHAVLTVELKEQ